MAPGRIDDWQRLSRTFTAISGSYSENVTDTSAVQPERLEGRRVTARYFAVFATASQITVGYLLALLYVFVLKNGSAFVRTAVFFPMVLPTVAVALLFRNFVSVGQKVVAGETIIAGFPGDAERAGEPGRA